MRKPAECTTMADVRAAIDQLDGTLVRLLAERARYIDAAARIKSSIEWPARIDSRVEQVVANVRRHGEAEGLSPDLVEQLWRPLIEWSIAREEGHLGPDQQRFDPQDPAAQGIEPAPPLLSRSK